MSKEYKYVILLLMRILMVSYASLPSIKSGVSTIIYNIAKELKKRGNEIYVFSISHDLTKGKNNSYYNGVNDAYYYRNYIYSEYVNITDEKSYFNNEIEKCFIEYLNEVNPDVVHFHVLQQIGINLIKIAKNMDKRTILTMHDWWWICPRYFMADNHKCNQLIVDNDICIKCLAKNDYKNYDYMIDFIKNRNSYIEEILGNYVDLILCVSNFLKCYIENNFLSLKYKIKLCENGIEVSNVKFRVGFVNENKITFGYVGGLNEIKGYQVIKDAFSNIPNVNYSLLIYGVDKPNKKLFVSKIIRIYKESLSLRQFILEVLGRVKKYIFLDKEISNNILYLPSYEENKKEKVFLSFDVLIIASTVLESFSLVAREAIVNGCVIISSNCGGPEELLKGKLDEFFYESNNSNDLRKIVLSIMQNKDCIKEYRENLKPLINNIQTIDNQVDELEEIYINEFKSE